MEWTRNYLKHPQNAYKKVERTHHSLRTIPKNFFPEILTLSVDENQIEREIEKSLSENSAEETSNPQDPSKTDAFL